MGRAPAFLRGSREGLWRAWGGWCGAEPLKVWSLTRSCPQSTSIEAVRQSSRSAPALAMEPGKEAPQAHRPPVRDRASGRGRIPSPGYHGPSLKAGGQGSIP